ncbi:hypothetical protein [Novosphingobium sp. MMS21-SN21R]|uniref:hypothetical protein n=1 Tax=Novosphingobium sp. MMS21-SN21R TaxID=2969298 RepID=UPI002884A71E|nr:hypothetical protein [Novosphingobium sp. MMS21-SN21R]MDT0510068.1 hypothetical protein [Novosphingobium sp. MMS21-SN21R]
MQDDQERRRNWRANWLSSIQEFADDETQRRSWLDHKNTNLHFSFVEYFSCYFDDLGLSDGDYDWALNRGMVSADEVEAVAAFHQAADTYDSPSDEYNHKAILADPKWAEVVAAAKRAQSALSRLIDDPKERCLLLGP